MSSSNKTAVHFGAGNIGRGFIGPLLSSSGYHVKFVDVQKHVVDALNSSDSYPVRILDGPSPKSSPQSSPGSSQTSLEVDMDVELIENFSGLQPSDPATSHAIAEAEILTTSVGPHILGKVAPTIAAGIARRRSSGSGDMTIIACENMVGGTSELQRHVLQTLRDKHTDADLEYAVDSIGWANCAIDRIVPPYQGDHPLEVGVEGFYEWVVERNNIRGGIQIEGMRLEDHLAPFLERKLYTLNCGHAIVAYIGHVKGYKTIDVAIADAEVREVARAAITESGAALIRKHGFNPEEHKAYIERTMSRYANPNIKDSLVRVSRGPLRKLSAKERLLGAINMCTEYGLPKDNLLKGVAAVYHFDCSDDAEAVELQRMISEQGIEQAIENTTGLKRGSSEHKKVMAEYTRLRTLKARL